jgi:hypothetical protein
LFDNFESDSDSSESVDDIPLDLPMDETVEDISLRNYLKMYEEKLIEYGSSATDNLVKFLKKEGSSLVILIPMMNYLNSENSCIS